MPQHTKCQTSRVYLSLGFDLKLPKKSPLVEWPKLFPITCWKVKLTRERNAHGLKSYLFCEVKERKRKEGLRGKEINGRWGKTHKQGKWWRSRGRQRLRARVKGKANVAGLLTGGPRGSYDRLIQPQPPPNPLRQLEMWVSLEGWRNRKKKKRT